MYSVHPPWFYRALSPRYLLCRVPVTGRKIYLTFDDGPVPGITPEVLEILRKNTVRATFFCVGDNVRKYQEIFSQITSDGHVAGNHTFNHLNGWKASPGEYYNNVMHCRDFFESRLFRPPHGRFTLSQYLLLKKEFRFVLWSVLTMDYHHSVSPEQCLRNATDHLQPGSIVVFHDSVKARSNLLYTLPRFIDLCLQNGYEFDLIPNP